MIKNKERWPRINTTRERHRHNKKLVKSIIGTTVTINDKVWRVADKTFRYGREWQYTLSHETVDGTYKSIQLNENALENIIDSGSRVIGELK